MKARLLAFVCSLSLVAILAAGCEPYTAGTIAEPQPTPAPAETVAAVPTATVAPTTVPQCSFGAAPTLTTTGVSLDAYVFSEPRVVLTHSSTIDVAEWLPDNQRLLIRRLFPNQTGYYIDVFNVQTGKMQGYGEGKAFGIGFVGDNRPVWLETEQKVAFTDFAPGGQIVLRVSPGSGKLTENVATGLASAYWGADPSGQQITFFLKENGGQPRALDLHRAQTRAFGFGQPIALEATASLDYLTNYQVAWHPDGNRVAFYNNAVFYLVDSTTGQTCEMDMERYEDRKQWALSAHWSPDGRYLAAFITAGDLPVSFTDLTVTDITTGERRLINVEGNRDLYALAWAPNSRNLLIVAQNHKTENEHRHSLYLVDVMTGDTQQILENYEFYFTGFDGIAWARDGHAIAVACPVLTPIEQNVAEGRLCIIPVEAGQ